MTELRTVVSFQFSRGDVNAP